MAALANMIKWWANIHVWSLQMIIDVTMHKMGGGIDNHLENQYMIVVVLTQAKLKPTDWNNPAKTFKLGKVYLVHKDQREFLTTQWLYISAYCKKMEVNMHAKLTSDEKRYTFARFIPTAFHFNMMGMVSYHQYPLYRLWEHGGGPSYDHIRGTEQQQMFNEVGYLVGSLINQGQLLL